MTFIVMNIGHPSNLAELSCPWEKGFSIPVSLKSSNIMDMELDRVIELGA